MPFIKFRIFSPFFGLRDIRDDLRQMRRLRVIQSIGSLENDFSEKYIGEDRQIYDRLMYKIIQETVHEMSQPPVKD